MYFKMGKINMAGSRHNQDQMTPLDQLQMVHGLNPTKIAQDRFLSTRAIAEKEMNFIATLGL